MIWLAGLSSILLVALDQLTKYWARVYLQPVGEKPFLPGLISFLYTENRGAAFGLMQGGRWFFIPLTLVVLIAILVYYFWLPREKIYWALRIPLIFVFAGAVGNMIDRALNGYVVDFLSFDFIKFPIFNVADICLVCGTLSMAFVMLFVIKDKA